MTGRFISVLAFCGIAFTSQAEAKFVNVPLPPQRPALPVSTEAPLEVVQTPPDGPRAGPSEIPGRNVGDIIADGRSRPIEVDPIQTLNNREWNWRHRVGYRSDLSTD